MTRRRPSQAALDQPTLRQLRDALIAVADLLDPQEKRRRKQRHPKKDGKTARS